MIFQYKDIKQKHTEQIDTVVGDEKLYVLLDAEFLKNTSESVVIISVKNNPNNQYWSFNSSPIEYHKEFLCYFNKNDKLTDYLPR